MDKLYGEYDFDDLVERHCYTVSEAVLDTHGCAWHISPTDISIQVIVVVSTTS